MDYKCIIRVMDKLGNATQSIYCSIEVVKKEINFLVMDKIGGNVTSEFVLEYSEYLVARYNILVHHQVPGSPETNMLDLSA